MQSRMSNFSCVYKLRCSGSLPLLETFPSLDSETDGTACDPTQRENRCEQFHHMLRMCTSNSSICISPVGAGQEAKVHFAFSADAGFDARGSTPKSRAPDRPIISLLSVDMDVFERKDLRPASFPDLLNDEATGSNVLENPVVCSRISREASTIYRK